MRHIETAWDYSQLAEDYDKRADYASEAITLILDTASLRSHGQVMDVGAGTGKLTHAMAASPLELSICAVEPNCHMRSLGVQNLQSPRVTWECGIAEDSLHQDDCFDLVTFGSSFNVVEQTKALSETARVLKPGGWFAALWNHRDLDDELQGNIEQCIRSLLPDFSYGKRRQDQRAVIETNHQFGEVQHFTVPHVVSQARSEFIQAWNSHLTLKRQAGERHTALVKAIDKLVPKTPVLRIPFTTSVWMARCEK